MTPPFLKQPPILPIPLFLWEKSEPPPFFVKISKLKPPLQRGVPTMHNML